jgi:hypothetical protein
MSDWVPNESFLNALRHLSRVKAFVCYDSHGGVASRSMGITEEFENACNTIQSLGRNVGKTLGGDELEEIEFEFEVEGEVGASDRGLFLRYPRQRIETNSGYLLVVVADGRIDALRSDLARLEKQFAIGQPSAELLVKSQPQEEGGDMARGVDDTGKTPWDKMIDWFRKGNE